MAIHVAILKAPYARLILAGTKTVESRLSKAPIALYRSIETGDRLFIKISAGPFVATAIAGRITHHEHLTADKVDALRERYQSAVCGDDAYWHAKRQARYATFIHLTHVEPIDVGPAYRKANMKAWHVLDDALNPIREVTLTAGAIRNRYVKAVTQHEPVTLEMPDGMTVKTDLYRGHRLRWRGWGRYFETHNIKPGDRVRFVALGRRRYRVSFHTGNRSRRP